MEGEGGEGQIERRDVFVALHRVLLTFLIISFLSCELRHDAHCQLIRKLYLAATKQMQFNG